MTIQRPSAETVHVSIRISAPKILAMSLARLYKAFDSQLMKGQGQVGHIWATLATTRLRGGGPATAEMDDYVIIARGLCLFSPSQKRWRSSNGLYLGFDVSVMDYNQRNHSISAIDHNVKETALNSL